MFSGLCVRNVTFGMYAGDSLGFLSQTGEGCSTLFEVLTGQTPPTGGHSIIKHIRLFSNRQEYRHHIGYCFQEPYVDDYITAKETLRLHCRLRGIPSEKIDDEVFKWTDGVGKKSKWKKKTLG